MARVYSAQVPYGTWWPRAFICAVNTWEGPYSGQLISKTADLVFGDIDRDLGTFEYRGEFASTGGKLVEGVISCTLNSVSRDIEVEVNLEVDGTPQIVSPLSSTWLPKWQAMNFAVGFPFVIPGYQLAWTIAWAVTAKPWPS